MLHTNHSSPPTKPSSAPVSMNRLAATRFVGCAEMRPFPYCRTSYSLQIVCEPSGTWNLGGLPGLAIAKFDSLSACLDFARLECAAAPATIELIVDGFYIVVHQDFGWHRQIVAPEHDDIDVEPASSVAPPSRSGLRNWVTRLQVGLGS
jgi:hypothetical protein